MAMVLALDSEPKTDDVETLEIFQIGDKVFTIEVKPRVNLVLKYLKISRTMGEQQAMGWLLEQMLGTESYDALMEYDDLTLAQLQVIFGIVKDVAAGGVEIPKAVAVPKAASRSRRAPTKR
jgi:hypothetical protein